MTSARTGAAKAKAGDVQTPLIIGEVVRRSGHEIRNALNGVAVNVEVVRSRVGRGSGSTDIDSFAVRASSQVHVASGIIEGLLAFLKATLSAQAGGSIQASAAGAGTQLELMIYGEEADVFLSDIKLFAERVGLSLKRGERSVILTVLPQDLSHSKE